GDDIRLEDEQTDVFLYGNNHPSDREGYAVFRRVVAHLSSIQDRHALHVEPIQFHYHWAVPAESVTPEAFSTTYKDFTLTYDPDKDVYHVTKRVDGRVVITNYDPKILTNEERFALDRKAEQAPFNEILLDVRPCHPGGEWPLQGRLRLRSFHEILTFLGR